MRALPTYLRNVPGSLTGLEREANNPGRIENSGRRRRRRHGMAQAISIGEQLYYYQEPLPYVPEIRARAHPETRLAVAEPSDGTQEGGKEDGSRKPTGAEFASGKATSDYFI